MKLNRLREEMPLVHDWLKYAEATRRLLLDHYSHYEGEELLEIIIAENVLTQIENLRTYPVIHSKLYQGQLKIYAWIYHIEKGEVLAYDPDKHAYVLPQSQLLELEMDETLKPQFPTSNIAIRSDQSQQGEVEAPHKITISAHERFPMTQLSPEQMERIYRGSTQAN